MIQRHLRSHSSSLIDPVHSCRKTSTNKRYLPDRFPCAPCSKQTSWLNQDEKRTTTQHARQVACMSGESSRSVEQVTVTIRMSCSGGDQGQGSRPRSSQDSGFHGPVASAVGERQHSGSGKRGWSGKPQANVGRHGTGGGFRFGTSSQAGQSVRPSSEPSRTRHQRGTTPRTHSCGTRTNRSGSSSLSSSNRSFGTGTVSSDGTEWKKVNFVAASRPDSHQTPIATG